MTRYRFIISIFGNRYFGMLAPLLYSIKETNPESSATIFWEEMDDQKISLIKKAFPDFEFIETNFKFSQDLTRRIASKTLMWEYASRLKMGEILIFVDVDMLIVKNLSPVIEKEDFDIIFTKKNELYPINTGMMVCKNNSRTHTYFEMWKNETKKILGDKTFFFQASSRDFPFGAPDQMALYRILNFNFKKENYSLETETGTINVKSMPCSILNETNSTKITDNTHIIHYKGGWQPILIDGYCFTKKRPKKDSWKMYVYYLKTFLNSVRYINEKNKRDLKRSFYGIKIPFYLDTNIWKENRLFYFLYFIMCYFRLGWKKLNKILKN